MKEIARLLLKERAVKLRPREPFRFASGILSPIYCDNRLLISHPESRTQIVETFVGEMKEIEVSQIAGTATAGIPWAAWIAQRFELPMIYVRSKHKDHGRTNKIEGRLGNGPIVVIEDLITTGGSAERVIRTLRNEGAEISGVLSIFSYGMEKAKKRIAEWEVPTTSLTHLEELLEVALAENYIEYDEMSLIEEWKKDPESWRQKEKENE